MLSQLHILLNDVIFYSSGRITIERWLDVIILEQQVEKSHRHIASHLDSSSSASIYTNNFAFNLGFAVYYLLVLQDNERLKVWMCDPVVIWKLKTNVQNGLF